MYVFVFICIYLYISIYMCVCIYNIYKIYTHLSCQSSYHGLNIKDALPYLKDSYKGSFDEPLTYTL